MIDLRAVGDLVERAKGGVAGVVVAVFPTDEPAARVDGARIVDQGRWPVIGPGEFLLACPDEL
jgi:hypothetical protein